MNIVYKFVPIGFVNNHITKKICWVCTDMDILLRSECKPSGQKSEVESNSVFCAKILWIQNSNQLSSSISR